ncbi:MAG TPA: hypothetical protein VGM30_04460 [Puia sp.]|jgi:hypothetical protein
MKSMLLIVAFLVAGSRSIHAQTVTALAEQLAALKELLQTTEKGYRLVENELQTIGGITNGEFGLHERFFDSLSTVKPVVAGDPRIATIRSLQTTLVQRLNADLAYWRKQRSMQP